MWFIVLPMQFRIGTQLLASSTIVSPKQDFTATMPLAMLLSHSDSMDVNVWARVPSICHTDLDCRMTKFKALNPRVKKVIASTVWSAVNLCCCSKSFILHSRLMCHTIPFCKNKRGIYTMHMISWEWMTKVSTPDYQSQFCHIGNIALQSFANNPGWLFLGGDFWGGKITLMDAFVAVTSVTQMATQNASHCGFDMFADVLGHGGCSYISVASSKNGSQGASAASSAVQGHDSLAKQGLQMLYISQRYRYIYVYIYIIPNNSLQVYIQLQPLHQIQA